MNHWLVSNVIFPMQERVKGHPTLRILERHGEGRSPIGG